MPSVTIDPRRHDAVLFDQDADSALVGQLREIGVGVAVHAEDPIAAADGMGVRAGRCVVVAASAAVVKAARDAGFALVIGVGDPDALRGADSMVADFRDIAVRTGDRRMSQLPDASQLLDEGLDSRLPAVFFDFDGTLSDIVNDPDSAQLVAGAAEALQQLAARCPVAILSGRDLADVTARVGLPGIWYAGSHGFELTAPDGTHHQNDAAAATIPMLESAAALLRERLGSIPGVRVEHKRFGVAVHYRNAARERVGEVTAAVHAAGQRDALRVTTGREVIELRPDIDWDKGKQPCAGCSITCHGFGTPDTDLSRRRHHRRGCVRRGSRRRHTNPGTAQRRWRPGHRRAVRAGQSGRRGRVRRPPGPPAG